MHADTSAVRHGEELNLEVLQNYLTGKIEGAADGILVEQFPGGHSNLTYLLEIGGREYVLRRAPLGPVAPKAHDMARESRVLEAVHPHFPPAPKVFLLCEDPAVLGAVFYLMERRRGTIIRDSIPDDIAALPEYPRRLSEALIDCMVQLHAIDILATGLIKIGKPEGFLQRQVGGWAERWHRAVLEPQPKMNRVIEFLEKTIPASGTPTLVHNDFKLDNVMFAHGNPDRVEAVLDWEMTTVGDPMCDLGLTLCYWMQGGSPDLASYGGKSAHPLNSGPGWYTQQQIVERYAAKTGRDMSAVQWHVTLGWFKLAVIIQQIYIRYVRGQTQDARFAHFGERVAALIDKAQLASELAG